MAKISFSGSSSFNLHVSVTYPFVGGLLLCAAVTLNAWYKGKRTHLAKALYDIIEVDRRNLNYSLSIIAGLLLATGIGLEKYGYGFNGDTYLFESRETFNSGLDLLGWLFAGLCVGLGTKLACGDEISDGVCGISRYNKRSMFTIGAALASGLIFGTIRDNFPFFVEQNSYDFSYDFSFNTDWLGSSSDWPVHFALICTAVLVAILVISNPSRNELRDIFVHIGIGFLFGWGLLISGITRRSTNLAFFILGESWDPALGVTLGTATLGCLITFWLLLTKARGPYAGDSFDEFKDPNVFDLKTLLGAIIFGIGWSTGGLSPSVALSLFPYYIPQALLMFIPSLIVGQLVGNHINKKWQHPPGIQLSVDNEKHIQLV